MRILRSIPELTQISGPLFLAIGVFDGVHLGHQAVISSAASHAEEAGGTAVVVTFDPHPAKVLRPQESPRLLTATQHKIALIRALGVSHLLVLKFDRELASTSPRISLGSWSARPGRCGKSASDTNGPLGKTAPAISRS